ncbi:MAG: hypothetical protein ACRDIY_01390, partial [Chloroflexota bacterium]
MTKTPTQPPLLPGCSVRYPAGARVRRIDARRGCVVPTAAPAVGTQTPGGSGSTPGGNGHPSANQSKPSPLVLSPTPVTHTVWAWGDNQVSELGYSTTQTCGGYACGPTPGLVTSLGPDATLAGGY